MQFIGFGVYGQCYRKADQSCKSSMASSDQMSPEIAKSCNARVAEFCKRYQTQEGFLKAKGDENAAERCGVTTASIKAAAARSISSALVDRPRPKRSEPRIDEALRIARLDDATANEAASGG